MTPGWNLKHSLLRLLLGASVLLPLGVVFGAAFVESCLPAYRLVFRQVADEFRLQSLTLDREGADRVVRARVTLRPVLVIDGKVHYPDPRGTANASTLIAHGLQAPILAALIALAWPARRRMEALWRLLLLAPLVALLVLSDLPCVLAAELWEIVIGHLSPHTLSPLVIWKNFLQGGGRLALGLVAGAMAIVFTQRLVSR
jgi:hypothetical protein